MRRWLAGLVLAACAAAVSAQAPPREIRLRLLDGTTHAPLAGSAVTIEVYVRDASCSQSSCYAYRVTLQADGDGIVRLPSPAPDTRGRPVAMLEVSAAGHVPKRIGPTALESVPPVTVSLALAAPSLADLRLRLVDAKTRAPLTGVAVHIDITYQQVLCVRGPCLIANSSIDVSADARGEVGFGPENRPLRPTSYISLTITAGRYRPLTLPSGAFAAPQPVTIEMTHE